MRMHERTVTVTPGMGDNSCNFTVLYLVRGVKDSPNNSFITNVFLDFVRALRIFILEIYVEVGRSRCIYRPCLELLFLSI